MGAKQRNYVVARSLRHGNRDVNLTIGAKRTGLLRCGSQLRGLWIPSDRIRHSVIIQP